jgi:hypothetical protein
LFSLATIAIADKDASAVVDLAPTDGGAIAALGSDAGISGAGGPRSPAEMLGQSSVVTAGQVNVVGLVNNAVIKEHPVGSRIEPIIEAIPQWQSFMQGADGKVDLLRDTDWILIFGPSFIHTDRDAIFVHYHVSDAVVDATMDRVARANTRGGAFDAGVPGVHAGRIFADNGDRAMMRVQRGLLLVVPPDKATEFAKVYRRASLSPRLRPGEAVRFTIKDPWRQIAIPSLKVPNALSELRIWVTPHNEDGTADIYWEGDCGTAEAAADVSKVTRDILANYNASVIVRIATRGLLTNADVQPVGTQMKGHIFANREQLEALLNAAAAYFGVQVAPAPGGSSSPPQ